MAKRLISIILILMMCVSLAACGGGKDAGNQSADKEESTIKTDETVSADSDTETEKTEKAEDSSEAYSFVPEVYETDSLTWDFDAEAGMLSIHGEGPMRDYSQEAPEWEEHKDNILTIIIDDGITSVGAYAFFNYLSLTEVHMPDSVEIINESAFDYDWELRSITIPSSLKYVGSRAFYNTLLWEPEDMVFPEGCEYIGDEAFHSALKSGGKVSLPSTLKYLGKQSFTNSYLSDFVIADANDVYCIDNHAIFSKDMKQMLMIAPYTDNEKEYHVPEGVEKIDSECFNIIQGIETVYIPASVTEISEAAFFSTFNLKEIVVDEANPNYKSENGLLLSKDGKVLLAWPDAIQCEQITVPEGVERLGAYLCYGRVDGSYTVVLSESIKEIGTMSLPANITSLTIPYGLETIDDYVFYDGILVENIYYSGTEEDWNKISIGEGNTALNGITVNTN